MITSPLRYPGGKAKLFDFVTALLSENKMYNAHYCEPYAGGAGLALKLLSMGFVKSISLNDIDPAIYAFWNSILTHPTEFCEMIAKTEISIDEWHKQKAVRTKPKTYSQLQLGFSTYFLNRTNRSGIIDTAGPIGGFDQTGNWKIDARFNKERQIENIHALSKFADQIFFTNDDATDFIKRHINSPESFIYLDPPYYVKGAGLYRNHYSHKDHEIIAGLMTKYRKKTWMISYDNVSPIRDLYCKFPPITYSLNYSANQKMIGKEVMFLSDKLKFPNVDGFSMVA